MDKFIVRLSILVLNAYIIIVLLYAFNGIDISECDYIFTDSVMFGVVLTTLVHTQGRYHCKWIRALCYNLITVPSINYIDYKYNIFGSADILIYTYCSMLLLSIIITIYLAIRHFSKVIKLKKIQNENRRRNESKNR